MNGVPLSRRYRLQRAIKRLPGLIVYYPLNEIEGTITRNHAPATKGSNNGTISGATIGQPGKVGKAYSFDGVNDIVNLTNGNSIKGLTAFTIGAIISVTDSANPKQIYHELVSDGVFSRLGFFLDASEKLNLSVRSGLAASTNYLVASSSGLSAGYHFVSARVDVVNNFMRIYDKGTEVGANTSVSFGGSINNNNPFLPPTLGARTSASTPTYTDFFNDKIQHLFITSSLISVSQLQELAHIAGFI